jgi:hypothetical protein
VIVAFGGRGTRPAVRARLRRQTRRLTVALSTCALAALLLWSVPGAADGPFRITYTPKGREGTAFVLDARVINDSDRDALDVWVTAKALSASGKVLATGITFVSSMIPSHDNAVFRVKMPGVEGVQSFQLAVTSFRLGTGSRAESP